MDGSDYHTVLIHIPAGKDSVSRTLLLTAQNVDLDDCTLVQKTILDADFSEHTTSLPAVATQAITLEDGDHLFTATCEGTDGPLTANLTVRAADGMPKKCKNFAFNDSPVTATSLSDLKSKMAGTWEGCVTTPWVPTYYIAITFNADGTYSAISTEKLDGLEMNAMYYGMESDSPNKKYFVNDSGPNNEGAGEIDIVFKVGSINRGSLKNIKLMDNRLSFEFFHRNQYGPLKFELYKK